MITESFDDKSGEIISPAKFENKIKCDVIIATFSYRILDFVVEKFNAEKVVEIDGLNFPYSIYTFKHKEKVFGLYKTLLGAPASASLLEEVAQIFDCKKVLVFGSAGALDKICQGKVVVPNFAVRDEGTSYHYAKAEDEIEIKNSKIVASFMEKQKIPFVVGKTWTTDGFYRETKNNAEKRKNSGCVAVDMECSALQAVANLKGLDLYYFFVIGDLLDAPEWVEDGLFQANHNFQNFEIALRLACEI